MTSSASTPVAEGVNCFGFVLINALIRSQTTRRRWLVAMVPSRSKCASMILLVGLVRGVSGMPEDVSLATMVSDGTLADAAGAMAASAGVLGAAAIATAATMSPRTAAFVEQAGSWDVDGDPPPLD